MVKVNSNDKQLSRLTDFEVAVRPNIKDHHKHIKIPLTPLYDLRYHSFRAPNIPLEEELVTNSKYEDTSRQVVTACISVKQVEGQILANRQTEVTLTNKGWHRLEIFSLAAELTGRKPRQKERRYDTKAIRCLHALPFSIVPFCFCTLLRHTPT
jgi:hypothetical protein